MRAGGEIGKNFLLAKISAYTVLQFNQSSQYLLQVGSNFFFNNITLRYHCPCIHNYAEVLFDGHPFHILVSIFVV